MLMFAVCWSGIDYSVKTLTLDNMQVAMQLWDTAGQERWDYIEAVGYFNLKYMTLICKFSKKIVKIIILIIVFQLLHTNDEMWQFFLGRSFAVLWQNLKVKLINRYRSITKQFFRKADGVVVMYDVTVEESFKAVQPWLTNVQVWPLTPGRPLQLLLSSCVELGDYRSLFITHWPLVGFISFVVVPKCCTIPFDHL